MIVFSYFLLFSAFAVLDDADFAGVRDGAGFADVNADAGCRIAGKERFAQGGGEGFYQPVGGTGGKGGDEFADRGIIKGVRDVVVCGSGAEVRAQFDADHRVCFVSRSCGKMPISVLTLSSRM